MDAKTREELRWPLVAELQSAFPNIEPRIHTSFCPGGEKCECLSILGDRILGLFASAFDSQDAQIATLLAGGEAMNAIEKLDELYEAGRRDDATWDEWVAGADAISNAWPAIKAVLEAAEAVGALDGCGGSRGVPVHDALRAALAALEEAVR